MPKRTHYPPAPFIFMDIRSTQLTSDEEKFLSHRLLAGVVLFQRNYENLEQLATLLNEIRKINPNLLFSIDQEGGRVQRFKTPFTLLPSMKNIGNAYLLDEEIGKKLAYDCGWLVGQELATFGIHINFAPVLDLNLEINTVIGDRAFAALSSPVAVLGKKYIEGIKISQVLPVAKHFPGHGGVPLDSHIAQPIDNRSFQALWEGDMRPFRDLSSHLPAIMASHVIYSNISPMPAGYCRFLLNDILRNKMNYKGLIFSDCLSMKAAHVAGDAVARIRLAYDSGCNYVLLCNHSEESLWDILELFEDNIVSNTPLKQLSTFKSSIKPAHSVNECLSQWNKLQSSQEYQNIRKKLEALRENHVST